MEKFVNVVKVKRDVQKLFEVIEDQFGIDEEEMIRIFVLFEVYQFRVIYDEYVKVKCLEIFILLMNEYMMEILYIKVFVMYGVFENFFLKILVCQLNFIRSFRYQKFIILYLFIYFFFSNVFRLDVIKLNLIYVYVSYVNSLQLCINIRGGK